jgi:hypothetical protein
MSLASHVIAFTVVLFAVMLCGLEIGRRIRVRRQREDPDGAVGSAAVDSAVFGLLGLLLAFTFTGAASRFDARRALVVTEANAVGTAWLRLGLLPAGDQPALRARFRSYLDARIRTDGLLPDLQASEAAAGEAATAQGEIWSLALAAIEHDPRPQVATLVVPALNEMFDVATSRLVAVRTHVPPLIVGLLFGLAALAAILAGYGMVAREARDWLHIVVFATVMTLTIYVILDLEFPRAGLIRVDDADRVLFELRDGMR